MSDILLEIKDLSAKVGEKDILKNVNLVIKKGETHVIMGPNGSGKSTLVNTIMSNPKYEITSGKIFFEGEDVTEMAADERARRGIFMSFQSPIEVPGISVENFIRTSKSAVDGKPVSVLKFNMDLSKKMRDLQMKAEYAGRYMNYGFSGGEKKKNEIFQMAMLEPRLSILDETDSGLDIDALRIVAEGVNKLHTPETSSIVITHYQRLLDYIKPQFVHVLYNGRIVKDGGSDLALELEKRGYDWIKEQHTL